MHSKLFFVFLLFAGSLVLAGCPDDDDATADDDDATADDDDATADDDDATGDDDDAIDYPDAVVPDFPGCTGNQFLLMLGDGTEIGPFDGFNADKSFANNFPQFSIRLGPTGSAWVALNGNYDGMDPGNIPFEGPSSQAGNVVLQASVDPSAIGGAPDDLAGNFGEPPNNLHPTVGGSVTFTVVPGPGVTSTGTFEGVVQKIVSFTDQVVLLGVSGCFDAPLVATD